MKYSISLLLIFISAISFAQKEFHVFPVNGSTTVGTPNGNGSIERPWDLQTALSQSSENVNGGDVIWIHEGVYTGRYRSVLESTKTNKKITVSAFKNDKVILNGNTEGKVNYVLQVNGSHVIYKNFEVTYLGDFSRLDSDVDFKAAVGINHQKGEDCMFQNLIIHNIPGSGIGSWKATGGTVIENCMIYNNGYQGKRGHGVGIYIQNQSDKIRQINNNIIFNNYYKGIEVWSATSGSKLEFVKYVNLTNNIIFNNGSPAGKHVDNVIIASKDAEGINVAKHINVLNNVLYHNVDFNDSKNYGYGTSLALGFNANAPVEDVSVQNNIIIGKNNALNILHTKSLVFKNNIIYTGYIHFNSSVLLALNNNGLQMDNNSYYTRSLKGFRILKQQDYNIKAWQNEFKIESKSELKQLKDFKTTPVIKVYKLNNDGTEFNIAILNKNGTAVQVNFNEFEIEEGSTFKIYDIENRTVVITSGEISKNLKIEFPLALTRFEKPLHNNTATKSANNFGVFRIEFEQPKKESLFKRLFGWLF